uniref:Uncharacterized protein n=1 Tax=Escherichia coli TaxID=562 RepID=A0A0C5B0S7_ECOLX|nr:hypothetical protein EL78_p6506 [Escherichia coli]
MMPGRTKRAAAATHSTHNAEGARASPHAEPTDDHPARATARALSATQTTDPPPNHHHPRPRHDEPIDRSPIASKVQPNGVQLRDGDCAGFNHYTHYTHRVEPVEPVWNQSLFFTGSKTNPATTRLRGHWNQWNQWNQ